VSLQKIQGAIALFANKVKKILKNFAFANITGATSYRIDYEHKDPIQNGPVLAAALKRGMWSMDQFCQEYCYNPYRSMPYYYYHQ